MILAKMSSRFDERLVRLDKARCGKTKNPYKVSRREIEAALRRLIRASRR